MYTINFTLSVTNFEPNWQEWTEILNLSQIVDQNNTCIYIFFIISAKSNFNTQLFNH